MHYAAVFCSDVMIEIREEDSFGMKGKHMMCRFPETQSVLCIKQQFL